MKSFNFPYSEPVFSYRNSDAETIAVNTHKIINLETLTYFKQRLYNDLLTKVDTLLPKTSKTAYGVVKIGSGITVTDGTISVSELSWDNITGKPSTFPSTAHTHTSANITDATSEKVANMLVKRDANGRAKLDVTGALTGNADTATKFKTARTINGVSFDGSANITITANPNAHNQDANTITTGVLDPDRLPLATETDKGAVIVTSELGDTDKTKVPTLAVVEEAYQKAIESGKPATSTTVGTVKPGDGLLVDSNGTLDIDFMTQLEADEIFGNPIADGNDLGATIRRDYVPKEDIINDIGIGGSTLVPSMDLLQLVWQVAQNGGSSNATVMSVLRSANRGRNLQTGVLNANSTLITSSAGVFFDPMLFIDGELYPKDSYTVDGNLGTITMKTVVSEKINVNYYILDNYPSEIKFTVTTTNFLMNSKLKDALQLGDLIQVEGESFAHDGQRHLRLVENTKKMRGIDIGRDGLFLNEVPSSRQNGDPTPVGSIVSYPGEIIPLGWCICDGREIIQSKYPDLFKILPTDTDGKKRIPDLRGEFVRGLDNGRGIDSGRLNGSFQGDTIRNMRGTVVGFGTSSSSVARVLFGSDSSKGVFDATNTGTNSFMTTLNGSSVPTTPNNYGLLFDASRAVPTSSEVRPRNIALNYIIKLTNVISSNEVLEASDLLNTKIEENKNKIDYNLLATLGMDYGGVLNNPGNKVVGVAYYDNATKSLYRCLENNTDVNVSASKYRIISNKGLDDKLQNLEPYAKIKNLGQITSGTLESLFNSSNSGFICHAYVSGFIPSDAPNGASSVALVIIHQLTSRHAIEWIDRTSRKTKIKEGSIWGQWY